MLLQIDFGPVIESRNPNLRESTVGMLPVQKIKLELHFLFDVLQLEKELVPIFKFCRALISI